MDDPSASLFGSLGKPPQQTENAGRIGAMPAKMAAFLIFPEIFPVLRESFPVLRRSLAPAREAAFLN
jgi:hypothetical protein